MDLSRYGNHQSGQLARSPGGFLYISIFRKIRSIFQKSDPPAKMQIWAGGVIFGRKSALTFLFFEISIFCKLHLNRYLYCSQMSPISASKSQIAIFRAIFRFFHKNTQF